MLYDESGFVEVDFNRELKITSVSLSNNPFYKTKFPLGNTRITMRCGYNVRNKLRWIILLDEDNNVLLPQTFLKFRKRCELNFNANMVNISGYVTLSPRVGSGKDYSEYDYINWANDFELSFVGTSYAVQEIMQKNKRYAFIRGS